MKDQKHTRQLAASLFRLSDCYFRVVSRNPLPNKESHHSNQDGLGAVTKSRDQSMMTPRDTLPKNRQACTANACDAAEQTLVFSIGINGYGWAWSSCVCSHRKFAKRWTFDYACVDLPWTVSPAEAAWLKVPLLIRALEVAHYRWILFLDADTRIRCDCPDFRGVATTGHDVYMAHGHSGRLNSGVMMVRSSEKSLDFFRTVLSDCENAVPSEDAAPYENGHIIKHGKANPVVGILERRWNNTADRELDDYIRHFTGPMAVEGRITHKSRARWQRAAALRNKCAALWTHSLPGGSLRARLECLADAVIARYSFFGGFPTKGPLSEHD